MSPLPHLCRSHEALHLQHQGPQLPPPPELYAPENKDSLDLDTHTHTSPNHRDRIGLTAPLLPQGRRWMNVGRMGEREGGLAVCKCPSRGLFDMAASPGINPINITAALLLPGQRQK